MQVRHRTRRSGYWLGWLTHRGDHPLPWTRTRQVYRLLALVKRYGVAPVNAGCGHALELDVVSVSKTAAMLTKPPRTPR